MNTGKRRLEGQSSERKVRRPVQPPISNSDIVVQPRVTEQIVTVRKGGIGNTGSNLEDLANALKGFGATVKGFGGKGKKGKKSASSKNKAAKSDIDSCYALLSGDTSVMEGDSPADLEIASSIASVLSDGATKEGIVGDAAAEPGEEVVVTEEEAGIIKSQKLAEGALAENRAGFLAAQKNNSIEPGDNPHLVQAGHQATAFNSFSTLEDVMRNDQAFDAVTSPDSNGTDALNLWASHFGPWQAQITDPKIRKNMLPTITKSFKKFQKDTKDIRTKRVEGRAKTEVNIFGTNKMLAYKDFSETEEGRSGFLTGQKNLLQQMRQLGYTDIPGRYVDDIAIPAALDIASNDPDTALNLITDLRKLDITGKGGLLGKIDVVDKKFETAELEIEKITRVLNSETDFNNQLNSAKEVVDLMYANEVAESTGKKLDDDIRNRVDEELAEKYKGLPIHAQILEYSEGLANSAAFPRNEEALLGVTDRVTELMLEDSFDVAREDVRDSLMDGTITYADGNKVIANIDNKDILRNYKGEEYDKALVDVDATINEATDQFLNLIDTTHTDMARIPMIADVEKIKDGFRKAFDQAVTADFNESKLRPSEYKEELDDRVAKILTATKEGYEPILQGAIGALGQKATIIGKRINVLVPERETIENVIAQPLPDAGPEQPTENRSLLQTIWDLF